MKSLPMAHRSRPIGSNGALGNGVLCQAGWQGKQQSQSSYLTSSMSAWEKEHDMHIPPAP